jgi:hypothetical protein
MTVTFQRQGRLSTQSATAQVPSDFGTAEFRALAGLGKDVSQLGNALGRMKQMNDQSLLMDSNSKLALEFAQLDSAGYASQYGEGTYTDAQGKVIQKKPNKDYANDYMDASRRKIAELSKNMPNSMRDLWVRNSNIALLRKSGGVVKQQEQMIHNDLTKNWYKQNDIAENGIVISGPAGDLYNQYDAVAKVIVGGGKASFQPETRINSRLEDLRTNTVKRSNAYILTALSTGNEAEAQKTLDFLKDKNLITGEDYKTRSDAVHGDAVIANANRTYLSGDPQVAIDSLKELDKKELSSKQLESLNKVNKQAKTQIVDNSDKVSNEILFDIERDKEKNLSPAERDAQAIKMKEKLEAGGGSPGNNKSMIKHIEDFRLGKVKKASQSDLITRNDLTTKMSTIHTGTNQETLDELRSELQQNMNKLSGGDYRELSDMLNKRIDKQYVDIIASISNVKLKVPGVASIEFQLNMDMRSYIAEQTAKTGVKPSPKSVYVHGKELLASYRPTGNTDTSQPQATTFEGILDEKIREAGINIKDGMPAPVSKKELDKLPSGIVYIDTDGNKRRKR